MSWYKRLSEGIRTKTEDKKSTPDGLWHKCENCKIAISTKDFLSNLEVCPECGHHHKIDAESYFKILFDDQKFSKYFENIFPADPLQFSDTKKYSDRIEKAKKNTQINEAASAAMGKISGIKTMVAAMDFRFIGGSMSSAVGEILARAIDKATHEKTPLIIVSKSGGARMMEAAYSLMQMAKTSAKLAIYQKTGLPYISLLTNPTTGGVTASFAMLGDFNIAEPNALIGFAGPRVIKETIGKELPKGFQSAEFLKDHGFIDLIVHRSDLKQKIGNLLQFVGKKKVKTNA
ncbi:MAG: acetyl-CoA carboxylase, carboxyltransferase subunit beta [Bacteroidota bacterium]|nr:acetyl-CoA carboxylase, carboxyltransferase subunit beta [Bacteroidota bacterium]